MNLRFGSKERKGNRNGEELEMADELVVSAMARRQAAGGDRCGVGAGDGDGDLFPRWDRKAGEREEDKTNPRRTGQPQSCVGGHCICVVYRGVFEV